jgi:hypothetical protein
MAMPDLEISFEMVDSLFRSVLGLFNVMNILRSFRASSTESLGRSEEGLFISCL